MATEARASARPVLVTGTHRSGTTWTGKMLSASPVFGYIHEPFRPDYRPGICRVACPHWFQYVCEENAAAYRDAFGQTIGFHYDHRAELPSLRTPRDVLRMCRDSYNFFRWRHTGRRPLVKDPIALLSAEWLASEFDMLVVVLIRHPAAFAASLLRKHFRFPFRDLLDQPLLMRDLLEPFRDEIGYFAAGERPIIEEAALLWNIFHQVILDYRDRQPDWYFVRHEDLSLDPIRQFAPLFEYVDAPYDDHVQAVIRESSRSSNRPQATGTKDRYHLNSRENIASWKKHLDARQVDLVRRRTEPLARQLYADDEW
jgi:hypothetical protein